MTQIDTLKQELVQKEQEYQDSIHAIDKKVLQDKTQLKKEMLQKVNEVIFFCFLEIISFLGCYKL